VYYDRLQTITLFFHEFFERVSPGTWRCSASSRLRIRPWKPFQTLLQEAIVCLERESFLMGGSFFNLDGELWLTLRKSRLVVVTILPSGIKTQDYDQTNERFPDEAIKLTLFHGHLQMTQKEKKKTANISSLSCVVGHLSSFSFFLFVEGNPLDLMSAWLSANIHRWALRSSIGLQTDNKIKINEPQRRSTNPFFLLIIWCAHRKMAAFGWHTIKRKKIGFADTPAHIFSLLIFSYNYFSFIHPWMNEK